MTLREQKGWAYGAGSGIGGGRGSQVFSAGAPVQADKSAEAMAEAARILPGIASDQPVNVAELATARDDMSMARRSAWDTNHGLGDGERVEKGKSVSERVEHG